MRYLVPYFLIALFAASAALAPGSLFYFVLFLGQLGCYLAALVGWLLERAGVHSRLLSLPQYFVLANVASVIALYKFLRGERYARWEPLREQVVAGTSSTPAIASR